MLGIEKLDSVLGQTKASYAEARDALEASNGDVNAAVSALMAKGYPCVEVTGTVDDELYYLLNTPARKRSEDNLSTLDRIHHLMDEEGLSYTEAKARLYAQKKWARGERESITGFITGSITESIKDYWDKLIVEIEQRLE